MRTARRLARAQGDYGRTIALHEESLGLRRQIGDKRGMAHSLHGLGIVRQYQAEHEHATRLLEEAVTLFQELEDRWMATRVLHNLGVVAQETGDDARAAALYRDALAQSWAITDRQNAAYCIEGLAAVAQRQGQSERAAWLFSAAAAIRVAFRIPLFENERADCEQVLARVREAVGEATFAAAWAAGQIIPPGQAVGGALAENY